tara:strand:+ start:76 stop:570 length:495 start_codon:yes stop_codon:yes gene_type:complete
MEANIAININDRDPITLETLKDLEADKRWFHTDPVTKNVYMYDLEGWAEYIAGGKKHHPLTRRMLSASDIRNIYMLGKKFMSNLTIVHSKRLIAHHDNVKKEVSLSPESPLFGFEIIKIDSDLIENKKKFNIVYKLTDRATYVAITESLSLTVETDIDVTLRMG